jgi:hypothetical protein
VEPPAGALLQALVEGLAAGELEHRRASAANRPSGSVADRSREVTQPPGNRSYQVAAKPPPAGRSVRW